MQLGRGRAAGRRRPAQPGQERQVRRDLRADDLAAGTWTARPGPPGPAPWPWPARSRGRSPPGSGRSARSSRGTSGAAASLPRSPGPSGGSPPPPRRHARRRAWPAGRRSRVAARGGAPAVDAAVTAPASGSARSWSSRTLRMCCRMNRSAVLRVAALDRLVDLRVLADRRLDPAGDLGGQQADPGQVGGQVVEDRADPAVR